MNLQKSRRGPFEGRLSNPSYPAVKRDVNEVLIVDDDLIVRDVIASHLEQLAHLMTAGDGPRALEKAKKHFFDLILMDIQLGPDIDGIETSRKIRELPGYEMTTIIAVTSCTESGFKHKCFQNGMDGFLSKPFVKQELLELIENTIRKDSG